MTKITDKTRSFQIKLYSVLIIILIALTGFYTYKNLTKFLEYNSEINMNNELHAALLEQDSRLEEEFSAVKEANAELNQIITEEKAMVLPKNQNLTDLKCLQLTSLLFLKALPSQDY